MKGYKEALTTAMTTLANDPVAMFVGYNVRYGLFGNTLTGVPNHQLIETPTAENLMVGIATGLSLTGYHPIICFERFDFVLNALDAIVNHLDKISQLSQKQYRPAAILRIVVGNRNKPLYTGAPHVQDFTSALDELVTFPVKTLDTVETIAYTYDVAQEQLSLGNSTAIIEYKDHYE